MNEQPWPCCKMCQREYPVDPEALRKQIEVLRTEVLTWRTIFREARLWDAIEETNKHGDLGCN